MAKSNSGERQDVYARITNQIVEALESGVKPWTQPWTSGHAGGSPSRPLRHNGEPYSGINVLSLWASAMADNFSAPYWMTFKQAIELGGHVRKGETGVPVVYAKTYVRTESDEVSGAEEEHVIPFLRSYTVFNVEQIDGLPEHYSAKIDYPLNPEQRIANVEAFFAATGVRITHDGARAFYRPSTDSIHMPDFEAFNSAHAYYSVLAHETTHWTGAEHRLSRNFTTNKFGDTGYAREELVAELGAAFLCADLGLNLEPRSDHACYISNWLTVLKEDKRAIFSAAAHAQRAAEYIAGLTVKAQAAA